MRRACRQRSTSILATPDCRGKPYPRFGGAARQRRRTACRDHPLHAHAWTTQEVCYLQDLFVDSAIRRSGCARRLIEAVAAVARERGCHRLYWTTKEDNATARSLYDRIARFNGFIRYDYPLD